MGGQAQPVPRRPNTDGADPDSIAESFCRRHGLAYCQMGLFDTYAQALRHLHAVGPAPYSAGA